jgi:hypothetical protein
MSAHSGLEAANMASATGKGKTKSAKRAKRTVVKDLAPRKGGEVKGGGINRIVVTDGKISAKI